VNCLHAEKKSLRADGGGGEGTRGLIGKGFGGRSPTHKKNSRVWGRV